MQQINEQKPESPVEATTSASAHKSPQIGASQSSYPIWLALFYGVLHAAVDFGSISAVVRASWTMGYDFISPFYLVFGYDLLAFALQAPLGALVDRWSAARKALIAGLISVIAAILCLQHSAPATMILAGFGNALFHIGAGALVLRASGGRAAPSGVFVAPGALGLGLGTWLGRAVTRPLWPVLLAVCAAAVVAAIYRPRITEHTDIIIPEINGVAWAVALIALLASVAIRSFIGMILTS